MRRFLKASAISALFLFVLLIVASSIVRFYFPPERIKALVVSRVSEALGRKVSVGEVDVSLFHGVDIRDVYIGEDPALGELPFVKVKRVTVGYSLSEIVKKKIVLDRVTVERPEVYIRSRKGRLALSDLIKRPPPGERPKKPIPITVLLRKGEVKGFDLFYDAEDAKAAIRGLNIIMDGDLYPFKGVNVGLSSRGSENMGISSKGTTVVSELLADLRLSLKGTDFLVQGGLSMKDLMVRVKGKGLGPIGVTAGMDLAGDINGGADIRVVSLAVGLGSKFGLAGRIREMKGLKGMDIRLTGESDLAEVSRIAKGFIHIPFGGRFMIDRAEIRGDLPKSLKLKTEASLKGVSVSHRGLIVPLDGTIKGEADSGGNIDLSEIRVTSGGAVNIEGSVSASRWGKGRVNGKAKVWMDNSKALGIIPNGVFGDIGRVELHGETAVDIAGGRGSEKGAFKVRVTGNSVMKSLLAGPLSAEEATVRFSARSDDLLKGKIDADAGIKGKGVRFNKGDVELVDDMLGMSLAAATDLSGRKASIDGGLRLKGVVAKKGDILLKEEGVGIAFSAAGDLRGGDVNVKRLELSVPMLLKADISGGVRGWGKDLDLKIMSEGMDYRGLLDRVPISMRQRLPRMGVDGKGSLRASISGSIPGKGDSPLNFSGSLKAGGLALDLPDGGIKVRDSAADIDFDISRSLNWVSGALRIGSLEKEGLLDVPLGLSAEFEIFTEGQDLKIKNLSVRVPQKGASLSVSGDVLNINAPRPNLDLSFTFGSTKKVELLKGINAEGAVKFRGALKSGREKELALDGEIGLEHISASFRERASVRDINGEIRVSQGIGYAKGLEFITERKRMDAPYMAPLYDLMRPYMKRDHDLTMESASFDGYEVGPLSMDIRWDNGNLLVDSYDLSLFDGSATGRMWAAYGKGIPEYSASSNITGVRFDRIFKDIRGGKGFEVNADLNLRGRGAEIEGEVNVTRIGRDILERGLLRLDPNESNPQIVDVRRKVNNLGWVPREVSLWIRHGELNMDITLQRRRRTLLNIVSLERIPVRGIPVGYLLKKGLKGGN
jgi:hypothetical protein